MSHMSAEQRAAYEHDPMVQYKPSWKALGNEDIAAAIHRIHDTHTRDGSRKKALDCWTCCCMANTVAKVIQERTR